MPAAWMRIYLDLAAHHRAKGRGKNWDDLPLPLSGPQWDQVSDTEKLMLWLDTLKWAQTYGAGKYIPELEEEEKYYGQIHRQKAS